MNSRVAVLLAVLAVTASAVNARDLLGNDAPQATPAPTVKPTPVPAAKSTPSPTTAAGSVPQCIALLALCLLGSPELIYLRALHAWVVFRVFW